MECLKVVVEPKQYSVHCCLRNYVELVIFVFGSLFIIYRLCELVH